MNFHVVTGLPRSGSTLLCNVLNQNPDFFASSTSPMCAVVSSMQSAFTASAEAKSEFIARRQTTADAIVGAMRCALGGWYEGFTDAKHVFDKGRGWATQVRLFEILSPTGKMVVCVRDLRDVLASVERQHAKTAFVDDAERPHGRSLFERASAMFAPDGIIGACVTAVDDLLRRKPECVHVVRYEDFVRRPKTTLSALHEELGLDPFDYDFDLVVNVSTDVDGLYWGKFPHDGSGAVRPDESRWSDWVSEDVAKEIMRRFPGYNSAFGYS